MSRSPNVWPRVLRVLRPFAAALALSSACISIADDIFIPDLGTAGVLGLSVQKEKAIGDFFMRTARGNMPVVDDPVMSEYIRTLGNKLLSHADNVNFPFEFFIVEDRNLNASAFLGGKVAVNTGLFTYAETEDQFASVIAHEISHVTQRHIARFLENMVRATQLSTAGLIGAVAMAIINPALGAAAVSTSVGVAAQTRINFTRDNEYEADRIGINLLYRSGLNPQGTVEMFRHLAAMQGNINPAFTLLIDHPLSDIRLAEAQNRVAQYQRRDNSRNPDYDFARARVAVRYSNLQQGDLTALKQSLSRNSSEYSSNYRHYALALINLELGDMAAARDEIAKLHMSADNLFILDTLTDIDLKAGRIQEAVNRLLKASKRFPNNQVVVANLASVYNESGQYAKTEKLVERYLVHHSDDSLALGLLETAFDRQRNKCAAMQVRAERYALSAAYAQSIGMYNQALRICADHLTRERIKARVSQIVTQRSFDEELIKN